MRCHLYSFSASFVSSAFHLVGKVGPGAFIFPLLGDIVGFLCLGLYFQNLFSKPFYLDLFLWVTDDKIKFCHKFCQKI